MFDSVNHPEHYNAGKYETIDVIEDSLTDEAFVGFALGNVLKYVIRCRYKGGVEDLRKAEWYLSRAIKKLDEGPSVKEKKAIEETLGE